MNLREALTFRRSVRVYDAEKHIDPEEIKECIELATLAPSSSNMQLWECYHVTDKQVIAQLAHACLDQSAAATADQLVVFVTRQDLYKSRSQQVLQFERENIRKHSPVERQEKRIRDREIYYGNIMPFLYARALGILGLIRKCIALSIHLFRPMALQVSENNMRVVVHKSCALAAQTFMLAVAEKGYDSCPMEGFDSIRAKKILKLPYAAEINMIISTGIRKGNKGIWGERFRVPFSSIYKRI